MSFLLMSLFAFGIVAVDQFTKFVVLENIALYEKVPFLPGFIGFTYAQNTGGAWSLFSGMMWMFVAVFAVLTVLIFVEYFWKRMPFTGRIPPWYACGQPFSRKTHYPTGIFWVP